MLALTKSSCPNFDKQITAVDKYDVKFFPHFDGSIQKYPTWQHQNIQVLRNFGMSTLADVNTVAQILLPSPHLHMIFGRNKTSLLRQLTR